MSQEKIKIKKWPGEAFADTMSGHKASGSIDFMNENSTEEEKRAFIHDRRKDALITSVIGASVVGVMVGGIQGLRELGVLHEPGSTTKIEKLGDQQGVVPHTRPGSGTMHTKSGDFHVSQK